MEPNKIILAVVYTVCLSVIFYALSDVEYFVGIVSIVSGFSISGLSFYLANKFSKTICWGKVLLFLGIAYFCYGSAELLWLQFESIGIEEYPSLADVLYYGYYIFSILAIISVFFNFIRTFTVQGVILMIIIPLCIGILYYDLAHDIDPIEMSIGLSSVILSSIISVIAGITAFRLKVKELKHIWIGVAIVMILNTLGDIWYYSLEAVGSYSYGDSLDILWFAADIILVFVLLCHRNMLK